MSAVHSARATAILFLAFLLFGCSPPESGNAVSNAELGVVAETTGAAAVAMPDS
jgi:hypothetical protein